ncbi:poly(ADP-ribose) glycohydrolase-like isoform X2 [Acanthaster planci]|uniref:poly(ADP-ribose) glycohydrolase n=1 Tax=Acanthaster planci TaxID=133434 RepID=A0A8B7YXK8_ACAPL|nr:poly(ADP-ribose) glycohydrolase-like isoform X2 [Acanthaster planci]
MGKSESKKLESKHPGIPTSLLTRRHLMETPKETSGKKRLRQTNLEDCFGVGIKRHRSSQGEVEASLVEDVEQGSMSSRPLGESSELRRRREQLAAAAERRRASQSPYSTPPHDAPSSPDSNQGSEEVTDKSTEKTSRTHGSKGTVSKPSTSTAGNSNTGSEVVANSGRNFESVFAYLEEDSEACGRASASSTRSYPSNRTRSKVGEATPGTSVERDNLGGHSSQGTADVSQKTRPDANALVEEDEAAVAVGDVSPTQEYDASLPLFSDSEPHSSLDDEVQVNKDATRIEWRGVDPSALNRAPACRQTLPRLQPSHSHTVLFRPHIRSGAPPRPFPDAYRDTWDAHHVRMPCSPENLYPVDDKNGQKKVQSRWELIETTLLKPIQNSWDLEEAILTYNARYCSKWNFAGLHHFFTEEVDRREARHFFDQLLPKMVELALMLPKLCTQAIPLLKRQESHTITLTQLQIASLLANAFFCTYPRRNAQQKKSEYSRFPDINFNRLFEGSAKKSSTNMRKAEKMRCIINYFRRVALKAPTGTVSFTRRAVTAMPEWEKSTNTLTKFHGNVYGTIEDQGEGMLQLDFANMYIGGGVLGHGLVQEEIRFMICPELIVSRLFTEVLEGNECLFVKGAERFSDYTGYASTFRWNGDYQDTIPRDAWGRKETEILAIDALVFRCFEDQFKPQLLRRELNKAFCGFYGDGTLAANLPAVATGNWGCGAFGGDARLKGLLQMMVAAECHRDMAYFTFGDQRLCYELHKMNEFLVAQGVSVGDLWLVLQRYRTEVLQRKAKRNFTNLYTFIYQVYNDVESSTDEKDGEEGAEQTGGLSRGVDDSDDGSLSPDYKVDTP